MDAISYSSNEWPRNSPRVEDTKPRPFINLQNSVIFSGVLKHRLPKLSTNHNGTLPGCTVYFDWLKVWKADARVLPKNLLFRKLIYKTV